MVLQAFWSLKHSRRVKLIQPKTTFVNLAFMFNVSRRVFWRR